jgi:hypothetical protein
MDPAATLSVVPEDDRLAPPFPNLGKYLETTDAMANPNPSPSTRFGVGNPSRGRQRAARDKISTAFLEALNEAFYEPNDSGGTKGLDAIK